MGRRRPARKTWQRQLCRDSRVKDWETATDHPGKAEGLVERLGRQELHPSDQVRGYTEYCRRFHSAVDAHTGARVRLLTGQPYTNAYTTAPNDTLTRDSTIFTTASKDVEQHFPQNFFNPTNRTRRRVCNKFATGHYRQERGFVAQIGAQILNPESTPFRTSRQPAASVRPLQSSS